jgi:hypothetical protein
MEAAAFALGRLPHSEIVTTCASSMEQIWLSISSPLAWFGEGCAREGKSVCLPAKIRAITTAI